MISAWRRAVIFVLILLVLSPRKGDEGIGWPARIMMLIMLAAAGVAFAMSYFDVNWR